MDLLKKEGLTGLAAVILLGGAYLYFFDSSFLTPPVFITDTNVSTFTNTFIKLAPVTFDTEILSDPRFLSLTDIAPLITSEPAGRVDPFAPLPVVGGKPLLGSKP